VQREGNRWKIWNAPTWFDILASWSIKIDTPEWYIMEKG